jgi:hypothetical protein
MIWQPTRDATLDNPVYYLRSRPSDLKMFYMNCLIEVCTSRDGKQILKNAADIWLNHPDRRQFINGVMFDRSGTQRSGIYNLWQGFAVTPKPGLWQLMQSHLLNSCALASGCVRRVAVCGRGLLPPAISNT